MYLTWDQVRPYIQQVQVNIMAAVREHVRGKIALLFLYTRIKKASEGRDGTGDHNPLIDQIEGQATGGSDPGIPAPPPAQCPARRIEFPGFAFVPMVNEPSLLSGFAANLFHFALASKRWRPVGLKQGETCQYNLAETQSIVKIAQSGQVSIDTTESGGKGSPPSSQADVIVNQGTHEVSRNGDSVDAGSIMLVAPMGLLASAQYFPAGTPLPFPLPSGAIIVQLTGGKITSGAPHFMA